MSRPAPEIQLSTEEKETLLHWMRSTKTERRMVERARVILLAANGLNGKQIAARMETRTARVCKWLRRFAKDRIAGLLDAPRPGEKRRKYNPATEERILKALDEPPPAGYSRWNGRLLAEYLGQVSKDQVWRVMRKHHLSLARRQSHVQDHAQRGAAERRPAPELEVDQLNALATEVRAQRLAFDRELRQGMLKHLDYDSQTKTLTWRKPEADKNAAREEASTSNCHSAK